MCGLRIAEYPQRQRFDPIFIADPIERLPRILDALGCAIAAVNAEPIRMLRRQIDEFGGNPCCSLIGGGRTLGLDYYAMSPDEIISHPLRSYVYKAAAPVPGDLNGDGAVNFADAVFGLKLLIGANVTPDVSADGNGDKRIGLQDVVFVLQAVGKLR